METVLLLPYHGTGHFNPCLSIADELKRSGYACAFAGSPYFREYVSRHQFPYHVLKSLPFASNFERWINKVEGKQNLYLAELDDRWEDRLYNWRKDELDHIVDEVKPSIIILDAMLSTDFIILYKHLHAKRIRFVLLHTMIPPLVESHRPPTNTGLLPHQLSKIKKAVLQTRLSLVFRDLIQRVKFLGLSNRRILRNRAIKERIPEQHYSTESSLLKLVLRNVTQLVLTPKEFDFPGLDANYVYAGFVKCIKHPESEAPSYFQRRHEIIKKKSQSKRKIVYCSFGTIAPGDIVSLQHLINNLVGICSGRYILIIALRGLEVQVGAEGNVFVFQTVDQPDVLEFSDVFVTHGGLNSISEAIQHQVPMLVIPVHANLDTQGNAARVMFHKIGITASLRDSREHIADKLQFLFSSSVIRENLSRLKQANEKYHVKRIESICNANTLTEH